MGVRRLIVDGRVVEGAIVSYECPLDGPMIAKALYKDPNFPGRLWSKIGEVTYTPDGMIEIGREKREETNE